MDDTTFVITWNVINGNTDIINITLELSNGIITDNNVYDIENNRQYFNKTVLNISGKQLRNLDFVTSIRLAILCSLGIYKSYLTNSARFTYSQCAKYITTICEEYKLPGLNGPICYNIENTINTFIVRLLLGKFSIYEKYGYLILDEHKNEFDINLTRLKKMTCVLVFNTLQNTKNALSLILKKEMGVISYDRLIKIIFSITFTITQLNKVDLSKNILQFYFELYETNRCAFVICVHFLDMFRFSFKHILSAEFDLSKNPILLQEANTVLHYKINDELVFPEGKIPFIYEVIKLHDLNIERIKVNTCDNPLLRS